MELNQILADLVNRKIDTDQMYCFKSASLRFESEEEVPWTLDGEFGGSIRRWISGIRSAASISAFRESDPCAGRIL